MIEHIFLFVEIISIIICIHIIFEEKIKMNIAMISLAMLDTIYISMINMGNVSKNTLPIIFAAIILYAMINFKKRFADTVCKSAISLIIVSVLQMISYIISIPLVYLHVSEDLVILIINVLVCVILLFTRHKEIYKKISLMCTTREIKVSVGVVTVALIISYYLYLIKNNNEIPIDLYIICIIFLIMVCYLVTNWYKTSCEVKKKNEHINMTRICGTSYESLLDNTRKKQHDFHNHITAIVGMHHSHRTYDALVEAQRRYIEDIAENVRYNKILLGIKEPILAGYLFQKISQIENRGVLVEYKFSVESTYIEYVTIYDLNEMIGILLDNAVETVQKERTFNYPIIINIVETKEELQIIVSNLSKKISDDKILDMFKLGYTSKKEGNGIGLAKLIDFKKIYRMEIKVENKTIEGNNRIFFSLVLKK